MGRILSMAIKDIRVLATDKGGLFFMLAFPLIIALLMGSVFGGSGGGGGMRVRLAVIDEDCTQSSEAFINELSASKAVELHPDALTLDTASELVRKGKLDAFVVVPNGFSARVDQFWQGPPALRMGIDPSRAGMSGVLDGLLTAAWFMVMHQSFTDSAKAVARLDDAIAQAESSPDINPLFRSLLVPFLEKAKDLVESIEPGEMEEAAGFSGIEVERVDVSRESIGPRSAFEVTFPSGMLWAVIGCVGVFAMSIVRERSAGTWLRLRIAPVSFKAILAGKALATFIACVTVIVLLLLVSRIPVFAVRIPDPFTMMVAIVSVGLCFVGITMLLSVVGKTEQGVGGISWGVMLLMAVFGGGMVPLFIMPKWMVSVSDFSPIKWSILALEGAVWRNFSIAEMLVPCGVLVGIGAATFALGVFLLWRTER